MKLFLSLLFTFLVCAPSIALPQSFQANNTGNQAGQAPAKLALTWPLPGVENEVWVVNNYFDLDPGPGLLDYRGGSRTLNNHFAVDIDVPNFRWMDNDFPVLAAAGGVVIEVEDSFFDRNLSCTGNGNYVTLKHTNGNTTDYGHLKQSSALVSVGQKVQQGDEIAVVGSSGCSTQPHLHFSLHDSNGTAIDPFNEGYWINPPRYNTPVSFMDAVINDGQITSVDEIKDPTPNLTSIDAGSVLGVGLSMANGHNGDSIEIRLINHGRLAENEVSIPLWTGARHTFWYFNFQLPYRYWGDWNVEILTNGNVVAEYPIEVLPPPGFAQEEHFMVPASNFQSLLDSQQTRGYLPIWIDTFQLQGITYFNTIFEGGSSFAFDTLFHLNGAAYQNDFNTYTSQGYRLTHVVR
nr:peptidoglycan DD-metalloendopeptidase family protein [Planctomycetota bacterium]